MPGPSRPDGINKEHERAQAGLARHANLVPIAALTVLMLAALMGFAGHEVTLEPSGGGVTATWHAPELIRNGEFFEIRLGIAAERSIGNLTIEIPASLWEDITINTLIPGPSDEASEDGVFRFGYGPLEAGSAFLFKVDGQINPDIFGPNAGTVRILDGEDELVAIPVRIEVLP